MEEYFVLSFIVNIDMVSDQYFLSIFTMLFQKMDIIYHFILKYNYIPFFSFLILEYLLLFFLNNFESMISLYFLSQLFEAVKELHRSRFLFLVNRTILNLLFVGHQVRKNICQCLSTIKVQLHSSFNLPKN